MKIYLISKGSYSDYHIHSIWSTREKAERMEKILNHARWYGANDIEELEMDAEQPDRPGYRVSLDLTTGEYLDGSPYGVVLDSRGATSCIIPDVFNEYFRNYIVKKDGQWKRCYENAPASLDYSSIKVYAEHVTADQALKAAQDLRAKALAFLEGL